MTRVSIDVVPPLARPAEVERAIAGVQKLRNRHARRQKLSQPLSRQSTPPNANIDVVIAAVAAPAGQPVGAESKTVEKARSALLAAQHASNVTRLAQQGAEDDVAKTIVEHARHVGRATRAGA